MISVSKHYRFNNSILFSRYDDIFPPPPPPAHLLIYCRFFLFLFLCDPKEWDSLIASMDLLFSFLFSPLKTKKSLLSFSFYCNYSYTAILFNNRRIWTKRYRMIVPFDRFYLDIFLEQELFKIALFIFFFNKYFIKNCSCSSELSNGRNAKCISNHTRLTWFFFLWDYVQ